MTIHDLLRHTSGLTYGEFGASPWHQRYARADLMNPSQTNADLVEKLACLPLLHQPGTTFEYGLSTDVLGRLIEVVSGQRLDRFIDTRLCQPLHLRSFTFRVNTSHSPRLAKPSCRTADDAILNALNSEHSDSSEDAWISGGGGLIGDAIDYMRFAQMLLNGGVLNGVRLLSPKTLALMTSDALPPDVRYGEYADTLGSIAPTPAMGQGFGLGFTVRTVRGRNPLPGSTGDCAWAGRWGTYFWIDPIEQLACVVLTQSPTHRARYRALARTLVYQAMETTEETAKPA
jgi:CubicO group peptidase (beta-lactamase class C family)